MNGLGLEAWFARQRKRELLALAMIALGVACLAFSLDRPLAELSYTLRHTDFNATAEAVTRWGKSDIWFLGSFILLAVFSLYQGATLYIERANKAREWGRYCKFMFVAVAASGIAVNVLKPIFGRARPRMWFSEDPTFGFDWFRFGSDFGSFPSGHSATGISVAIALGLIWPKWRWGFWIVGGSICLSRVGVNAHYLSDTLFGGVLAVVVMEFVTRWFQRRNLSLPRISDRGG